MKPTKHFTCLAVLSLSGILLSCGVAHAEGKKPFTGAFGVNRVVRSDASATTPSLTTSGTVALSFVQPVNVAGKFDVEVNPFNNKPTAYLGGSALGTDGVSHQFDAGVQFDTVTFGSYEIGWAAFFSRDNTFVSPTIYQEGADPIAWSLPMGDPKWSVTKDSASGKYIGANGAVGTDMVFTITPNGPCQINLSVLGQTDNTFVYSSIRMNDPGHPSSTPTDTHPVAPWYDKAESLLKYNSANQSSATVKRVSGMTRRQRHYELDGSQMSTIWSKCTVNGGLWVEVKDGNVTASHVDQNVTGYDSPEGTGATAYDRRIGDAKTADSRTITAFSDIPGVSNEQARSGVYSVERYTNETVSMNMGTATALEGDQLEWE